MKTTIGYDHGLAPKREPYMVCEINQLQLVTKQLQDGVRELIVRLEPVMSSVPTPITEKLQSEQPHNVQMALQIRECHLGLTALLDDVRAALGRIEL